jgi:hypothetical protein
MKSYLMLASIFLWACSNPEKKLKTSESNRTIDSNSLNSSEIISEKFPNEKDTLSKSISIIQTRDKIDIPTKQENIIVEKPVQKNKLLKEVQAENHIVKNDTTYYYYSDGKISVKMAPKSDNQSIWVYSRSGALTYELENVLQSFTIINHLFFDDSDALDKVVTSTNPGASLYMYSTTTWFSDNNEPLRQIREKTPASLEDYINNTYLWDSKNKTWVQQIDIVK